MCAEAKHRTIVTTSTPIIPQLLLFIKNKQTKYYLDTHTHTHTHTHIHTRKDNIRKKTKQLQPQQIKYKKQQ